MFVLYRRLIVFLKCLVSRGVLISLEVFQFNSKIYHNITF